VEGLEGEEAEAVGCGLEELAAGHQLVAIVC
jgi:DNA repair ATPase RecN